MSFGRLKIIAIRKKPIPVMVGGNISALSPKKIRYPPKMANNTDNDILSMIVFFMYIIQI